MKRDEEILKAARNYVSGVILSSPSNVIHFANGAKWADEHPNLESLWHDASEEPKAGKRICVHFGEDTCGIYTRLGKDENKWRNWCRVAHALRWAYISDLLPKQFRNSKQEKGGEK